MCTALKKWRNTTKASLSIDTQLKTQISSKGKSLEQNGCSHHATTNGNERAMARQTNIRNKRDTRALLTSTL